MQAILTRVLPATNTKPTRIKAECARGSIISSPSASLDYGKCETHVLVARKLADSFVAADVQQYGPDAGKPWDRPFVTGCLPSGDFAHVFVEPVTA